MELLKREAGVCCRILKSSPLRGAMLQSLQYVVALLEHVNLKETAFMTKLARADLMYENLNCQLSKSS